MMRNRLRQPVSVYSARRPGGLSRPGKPLNFVRLSSMRKSGARVPLDAEGLWQLALKVLGARACSSGEMRQKLRARAGRAEDVDSTLARLKQHKYLDDRRF